MSESSSNEAGEDQLARAAAAGPPLDWDDDESGSDNLEAGEAHDSPAAVDEELVGEGEGRPDPMYSIYREPQEQLREERRD